MSFAEVKKNFGFGCMRLPMQGEEVDLAQFSQMVDEYLAAGQCGGDEGLPASG